MTKFELQEDLYSQMYKVYTNFTKTSTSRYSISYLETRQEMIEEYWKRFSTDHREILMDKSVVKEEKAKCKELYDKTEDFYLDFKTILKEHIASQTSKPNSSSTVNYSQTKLPAINLPVFTGNYRDWINFKDLFSSLIDGDRSLSDIQKHHYLRSSLKGEAEQLLRHFDVTAANYKKAWEALVNRYSNKRIIVNTILNRLLNQRKLTNECPKGIKELLDTTNECLSSLGNLSIDTVTWDPIVVHLVVSKLDIETHKCWEQSLGSSINLPTYAQFTSYLEGRFRAMEMIQATQKKERRETPQSSLSTSQKTSTLKAFSTELNTECTYCNKNHYICHCPDFALLGTDQRKQFVQNNNLCFNCLVKGHSLKNCRQKTTCRTCSRKHHTLLHYTNVTAKSVFTEETDTDNENTENSEEQEQISSLKVSVSDNQVVLATAQIRVKDKNGTPVQLRALVDQGSQASFITESVVQLLGLKKIALEAKVTGIGNNTVKVRHIVQLNIYSSYDLKPVMQINAHVLTKLTPLLPTKEIKMSDWPGLNQINLADPHLHSPGPIHVLLGAEVHASILLEGLNKHGSLIAQNSQLGWLVSGTTATKTDSSIHNIMVSTTLVEIDRLLRKFWETEEYQSHEKVLAPLDLKCEQHYQETHRRNGDGRYVVRLPFKDSHEHLGNTRGIALKRLLQMEKKFTHKSKFRQDYVNFIDDYQKSNHMEDVDPLDKPTHKVYYLPHHAVVRESSTTTKLRVVFDGTAQPRDGNALNEELLTGPPLQQDLRDLIIRWRSHKVCLLADVKQMYRQILVSKEDVDFQRILWRVSPHHDITEKRLLTVSYGTSCAPFLAIRTLKQLAENEKADFPDLVDVINIDFYMDDLLTGTNSEEGAISLQKGITQVMSRGQFEMHKWATNSSVVLHEIPKSSKAANETVNITMDDTIKALGIRWNSRLDVLELKLDISEPVMPFTKTTVLSDIARAFDPLGYLGPVTITAKMFLQKLWLSGVSWTDELPSELATEWANYRDKLLHMEIINLERWFKTTSNYSNRIEVHGFSDASCLAYAAVVYIRVITPQSTCVSIVIAKTKVAPVKQVSIPRLELCGAVLLSKLLKDVQASLRLNSESVFAWTDSMIVLAWLRKNPSVWKTYVANRTSEILNVTNSSQWHHIDSTNNPADSASRGISPETLKNCDLWWHGPKFLREIEDISVLSSTNIPDTKLERKLHKKLGTKSIIHSGVSVDGEDEISTYLNKYSKLTRLIRVTGYILKFINICKARIDAKKNLIESPHFTSYLTVQELRTSFNVCIRLSQEIYFPDELQILRKGGKLPKSSGLVPLVPFIDKNGIIRVSGRLRHSSINFNAQSPVVLSSKCHLALLIVQDAHILALHGGPQLTLNVVRQKYWIIGAKNLIKRAIHRCIICFKHSATPINQLMGQLPASRVTPDKPFRKSGVDYAGPVMLKLYPGRCQRTCKAYICLFVCTVTKASHLELVSDLSTSAFIAAFRRFTSRRGHCSDLWSDCATNFVGASNELDRMFKNRKSKVIGEIMELLAKDNTTWHFIPPGSPHFGGLWEAGVKSVKTHLKRVIGQTLLTFEEYATLLAQVEACVNSRPLTPISNSLDDVSPITPGHFLIGEAPITVPDDCLEDVPVSRLDRWQMLQKMVQNLWARWSSEYLTTLHNRYKWSDQKSEPDIGTVVLVKDERLPPGKWSIGRIVDKHPGKDGLTRVVTLKFKNNTFRRPVTKICPLPLDP